ncbi:UDP-N-acetylmuramoyl-L-alanyl-D-glutamate--2,6-diaminopimelate ligase [Patescibacteria group bacterium]|nr:UDP-N-acetylmuramoyl-L-alanyl-D-glutamate--2,6-diaminopimelate ligase [Patescibacteria group bacterium]
MLRKLKNFGHWLEAVLACFYYGFPGKKLTVIGITGTDGKTTTTNLVYHILTEAGHKTAVLSTLSSAHTTTPTTWKLQKFLVQSLRNKCTHVVLEVSSHAIDQNRIWGIPFAVGVLTNIADNEHLDYHKTFENYRNTKLKFLKSCKQVADWTKFKGYRFKTQLAGDFNRENCLAAISVAKALGIEDKDIREAVANFEPLPGRLEVVAKKPFTVIVDFAHTPQAFEKVLPVAKKMGKRLIHVFGCTGNRDKGKRPLMGTIAAKYDDIIFLTHEDTYNEKPEKIIDEIEKGIANSSKEYYKIADRKEAIHKALLLAKPGDVVLLTGVGHQKSMNLGGKEVPWSDQKIALELLNANRS